VAENGNDFLSAVYSGDTLYTVWGDTRNGKLNIWFAKTIASTNTTVDVNILNESNDLFNLFPNPAGLQLQINFKEDVVSLPIEIFNMKGQVVYNLIVSERQNSIDVSQWQSGIYLIKIDGKVQRFVVD
jgi:hypothetical protein